MQRPFLRMDFTRLTGPAALATIWLLAPVTFLHGQSAMQREQAEVARRVANERYNSSAAIAERSKDYMESAHRMNEALRGFGSGEYSSRLAQALADQAEEERLAKQAEYEKVLAARRAVQEAEDARRHLEFEREQALYRANKRRAEDALISQLTRWQLNLEDKSNAYNLCRVHLGIHPEYGDRPAGMGGFTDPKEALRLVSGCIAENNTEVVALAWDSVVANGPHAKRFNIGDLEWYKALNPMPDGSLCPIGNPLTGEWLRASLSERVLANPRLKPMHAVAYKSWQRDVSITILQSPDDTDRIFDLMGDKLPERLLRGLPLGATGAEASYVTRCLLAYGIVRSRHRGFSSDAYLTRRAVALAQSLGSPFVLYKMYSLTDDPRRWPALRAALAEKTPSAECLRAALSIAAQDPELVRLREADPDLLSENAPLREISKYAMMLAALDRPFVSWESDTPLASTLADLAARSLFHKELTAAIPVLVDKARKSNCELLALQLGIVEAGLLIRRGQLSVSELPRLRSLAVPNIPGNSLSYDELLGFTPSEAAACLARPELRAAGLDVLRSLAGNGSWKAAEALRLAGAAGGS